MAERPEKKSERFEIRLPYSKKQDFVKACEDQGDTPSSAVRRFIDGYVRRADADNFQSLVKMLPGMLLRNWSRVLSSVVVLTVGVIGLYLLVGLTWRTLTMSKIERLFIAYDKNNNQVLDIGEVSDADEHLHRVLNVDGKAGISLEEFWHEGKISWSFVDPETFEVVEQSDGLMSHRSKVTQTHMLNEGDREDHKTHTVEFDLTNPKSPKVMTWERGVATSVSPKIKNNGSVYWVKGQDRPVHVMGTNRDVFLKTKP